MTLGHRPSSIASISSVILFRKLGDPLPHHHALAAQFALAPENSITFAHFSVSSAMIFANSAGEPMIGGPPSSAKGRVQKHFF